MRRILFALSVLAFSFALVGCHKEEPELDTLDDVRKASEGKENLDGGTPPGGTFSR